jgi:hypothetical protein
VGAQADDGVVDVVDGEHDAMQAQRVGRRVLRLGADRPDNITEAAECCSVCSPAVEGSLARFAAALSARSALRGSQGSPVRL